MEAYLDNSATTKPCAAAVDAMVKCMTEGYYNPSSVYKPAVEAFQQLRACRELILKALHAGDHSLVFTSGGTESNNLAILGTVGRMRGKQLVAVSAVEHPSVRESFAELERQGHEVRVIGVSEKGELDWDALSKALDDGASFVSCMQVNNETGAKLDVARLHELVNGRAIIHVDGVQGFLRVPIDLRYVDLYTLSSHKIHGPKGEGALVYRKGLRFVPRQIGGGQESGLRSGTENTPGIAGLMAAVQEMLKLGPQMQRELMQKKLHLIEAFKNAVPELLINGPEPEQAAPHIVNLSFPGVRGEVMLHALESKGVYASTGSACSSKKLKVSGVLTSMGIAPSRAEWALRFSLSPHTTIEEIDYAAQCLAELYAQLKKYARR
ncbi:MAG: cysteine desulfurase family protein [Clostridia bacterium]|nr:cysteine desulfurase family protein [Clostridia bacterium]